MHPQSLLHSSYRLHLRCRGQGRVWGIISGRSSRESERSDKSRLETLESQCARCPGVQSVFCPCLHSCMLCAQASR